MKFKILEEYKMLTYFDLKNQIPNQMDNKRWKKIRIVEDE